MRVKGANKASAGTRLRIKQAFVELMHEKKKIGEISVSDLARRLDIDRSTFYSHYKDLYAVASDIEADISRAALDYDVVSREDVFAYIRFLCDYFYENREMYSLLLTSYESMRYLSVVRRMVREKLLKVYQEQTSDGLIAFKLELFTDGMAEQLIRYFRGRSMWSFEEIRENFVTIASQLFNAGRVF